MTLDAADEDRIRQIAREEYRKAARASKQYRQETATSMRIVTEFSDRTRVVRVIPKESRQSRQRSGGQTRTGGTGR